MTLCQNEAEVKFHMEIDHHISSNENSIIFTDFRDSQGLHFRPFWVTLNIHFVIHLFVTS